MRGFPVNGDPRPAELSRPPEKPPPELGYRCAQGRRLDLFDNSFLHLGDIGALANVRFAAKSGPSTFSSMEEADRLSGRA